ncbi:MAG TPA: 3D domain-containing protein [Kofleriaceae bacterium]|nr:3D domain-containing protein [Kofleriaceae bacterium]
MGPFDDPELDPEASRGLGELVRAGIGYLADLVARIVNGIRSLSPLVLAVGCTGPRVEPHHDQAPEPAATVAQPPERSDDPKQIGQFTVTFYYVIGEEEVGARPVAANDNDDAELAATDGNQVTLFEADRCTPIADVSQEFATQLAIQGTGKLRDGRVLNIWGHCKCGHSPCFKVTANQWGTSGSGKPLQPFRTVAVDPKVVKLGSLLYVPLLDGRTMPGRPPWGGYVHDGCVVADDTGGHIDGNRLDLFVGRKGYFLGLSGSGSSHAWARHVPVYDGSTICERKGRHVARKTGSI